MKSNLINNNMAKATTFSKNLSDITGTDNYILREVRTNYIYKGKERTDDVDSISYSVIEPNSFSTFKVKIKTAVPQFTQAQIEASDANIWVNFENAIATPYAVEYGNAKLSITANSIAIVPDLM